jgi:hypothetical protein
VPDFSGCADPNTGLQVYLNGAWQIIGGTSGVAPFWAGVYAALLAQGIKFQGGIAQWAWANRAPFTDITQGNNGAYVAAVGPDACTGVGVLNWPKLLAALSDHAKTGISLTTKTISVPRLGGYSLDTGSTATVGNPKPPKPLSPRVLQAHSIMQTVTATLAEMGITIGQGQLFAALIQTIAALRTGATVSQAVQAVLALLVPAPAKAAVPQIVKPKSLLGDIATTVLTALAGQNLDDVLTEVMQVVQLIDADVVKQPAAAEGAKQLSPAKSC